MSVFDDGSAVERALSLLGSALEVQGAVPYDIVVIGGAAMSVLGIGIRPTKDVDVLGLCEDSTGSMDRTLAKHKPLPEALLAAAATVADAMGLDSDWLNAGPADLLDHGLPEGFERRLTSTSYGPLLTVWLPSREDLICLKTYAAADTGVGRHTEDLEALRPSCEELIAGALWAQSQDPSEEFRAMLAGLLRYFDCEVAVKKLGHG
jgi:hypothetical protein